MARARKDADPSVSMNMTPLIDVVFLLIIFFLVSSHLARQETQLELDLPDAASGDEDTADGPRRVTLNLMADGTLLLGGERTTPKRLEERLSFEAARSRRPLEVRVRADRAAPYGAVSPVLLACATSGVWDVSFAVREEAAR